MNMAVPSRSHALLGMIYPGPCKISQSGLGSTAGLYTKCSTQDFWLLLLGEWVKLSEIVFVCWLIYYCHLGFPIGTQR